MKNPEWCKKETKCTWHKSEIWCSGEQDKNPCAQYTSNPKMDFFTAWQKAEEGDKLCHFTPTNYVIKNSSHGILWDDMAGKPNVLQYRLFEKEWAIIPKKKKVVITIPEGAENVQFIGCDFNKDCKCKSWTQISYELPTDD